MENTTQDQPNNDSHFDVFISYRHLGKGDDDHRHSTSLARSVALELDKKGYSVFYDCWCIAEKCREALKNSDYFIILVTKYSFNTNEKGGESFKEELQKIKEITDKTESKKDNVFLLEVDNAYKNENSTLKAALKAFTGTGLEGTIKQLLTDQNFSDQIDLLTKKPEHEGEKRIGKPSKLSTERYKRYRPAFIITLIIMLCVLIIESVFFGISQKKLNDKEKIIEQRDGVIEQYKNECIVFAGGGTVQQYLNDSLNKIGVRIDVKNYQDYPSKYIHLPSKDAWSLLWDDVNEIEGDRTYCPIILSTTRIDITEANIEKFKENRRIAEYYMDTIPLMVQILDRKNSKAPITLDSLRIMLNDTNYEIWTTTERSGTYREYKEFLDKGKEFNLDNLVNNQKGGRKNFNPMTSGPNSKKTKLFLANSCYYYNLNEEIRSDRIVVSNTTPQKKISIPLYVYTIAVKRNGDCCELLPQSNKFFNRIGADTTTKITINDSIVVPLARLPRKDPLISSAY